MKKTRRKTILRGIAGNLNRYLSILFIVALGSGFMAGLTAASPDMYETAARYFQSRNWYDLDAHSVFGFTDDDIEGIRSLSCVETLQPVNMTDVVLRRLDTTSYAARVFALLGQDGQTDINVLSLVEGRFPETENECVYESFLGKYISDAPQIGDVLTVSGKSADSTSFVSFPDDRALTVVGIVESPMCISILGDVTMVGNGTLALNVYTLRSFFPEQTYSDLFLTVSGADRLDPFSDDYRSVIARASEEISTRYRFTSVEADDKKEELLSEKESLSDMIALLRHVEKAVTALEADKTVRAEQSERIAELIAADNPLMAGHLYRVSESLRSDSHPVSGIPILSSLEESLALISRAVDNSELWLTIRTREDSTGFESYRINVGKVGALSRIFPAFFFLVALLVALTTMTRLVEEQRPQIGTLKAIGFGNGQILAEYLIFSLSASVLGCVIGLSIGFRIFPAAISSAYSMLYFLPKIRTPFRSDIALWVVPTTIGSILLATLLACWNEFRSCPARLMQPKAPPIGKRIWLERIPFLWNRLSFTKKVTFRNLFRYKKRFFMTVIGVAGCSALLVTGFGLRDSITDIVEKQFGQIYRFELMILVDDEDAAASDPSLSSILNDPKRIVDSIRYSEKAGKAIFNGKEEEVNLSVPREPERYTDFVNLRNRRSGEPIPFPETGVVLTEKLCEELGLTVGDTVTLENGNGARASYRLDGITENYLTSFAYLSPASYEAGFSDVPEFNYLLCRLADSADSEKITEQVIACEHALYARSSVDLRDNFNDSIRSINGVILVLILASGLLCLTVLYNLSNVNICERRKELATIRVLGFHRYEAERYIFREINLLSLIGSAFGLLIGVALHAFVIRTVEIDQVMFGRTISPFSFLASVLITLLFTLIVDQIMRRPIRRIDMVEAMKAND